MRRSNCFFFAARAWWRWRHRGAYWCVRRSRHIAGWHWLVNYRGRWVHFEPREPQPMPRAIWHKLFYLGSIKTKD